MEFKKSIYIILLLCCSKSFAEVIDLEKERKLIDKAYTYYQDFEDNQFYENKDSFNRFNLAKSEEQKSCFFILKTLISKRLSDDGRGSVAKIIELYGEKIKECKNLNIKDDEFYRNFCFYVMFLISVSTDPISDQLISTESTNLVESIFRESDHSDSNELLTSLRYAWEFQIKGTYDEERTIVLMNKTNDFRAYQVCAAVKFKHMFSVEKKCEEAYIFYNTKLDPSYRTCGVFVTFTMRFAQTTRKDSMAATLAGISISQKSSKLNK